MKHFHTPQKKVREHSLDFLRGIAVFLMILSHSLWVLNTNIESNVILSPLVKTGNTICFTIFLFVSGASTYFAYLKKPRLTKDDTVKLIHRFFYFLIGYLFLAFIIGFFELNTHYWGDLKTRSLEIMTFQYMPSFVEFMVPFIAYTLSMFFFFHLYKAISKNILFALELGYAFFIIGFFLSTLDVPVFLEPLRNVLAGSNISGIYRFPILQYFPVFLIGMSFGHYLTVTPNQIKRDRFSLSLGIGFSLTVFVSYLLDLAHVPGFDPSLRFPPTVGFLGIGLASAFFFHVFITSIPKPKITHGVWKFLNYLGKDAFDIFLIHTLLMYTLLIADVPRTDNTILTILGFFGLLFIAVLIASLSFSPEHSIFRLGPLSFGKKTRYLPQRRYLIASLILLGSIGFGISHNSFSLFGNTASEEVLEHNRQLPNITTEHVRDNIFLWFDSSYINFRQVKIYNQTDTPIGINDRLTFEIPTYELANRTEFEDVILTYYTHDDSTFEPIHIQVPAIYEFTETGMMKVEFSPIVPIMSSNFDSRYFLFYESKTPVEKTILEQSDSLPHNAKITIRPEISQVMIPSLSRKWVLLSGPRSFQPEPLVFRIELKDSELWYTTDSLGNEVPATITYSINGTDISGQMERTDTGLYEITIDYLDFSPGEYSIVANIETEESIVFTQAIPFYLSHPMYVVWTIDWEGWDIENWKLNSINNESQRHFDIPITHFFNPRIFIPQNMSTERADYYVNWVLGRQYNYGDEIQLHMHMNFDLVDAAFNGIIEVDEDNDTPGTGEIDPTDPTIPTEEEILTEERIPAKTSPAWGFMGGGYDVKTTAYNYEEFTKLLVFAKEQFDEHGLPPSTGYRAGGWFIDEENLQALDDFGFLYDSSGREQEMWGGVAQSPWNLNATTQPFYPSRADQNTSGSDNLTLLEIPNNGADAYDYTSEDMIEKFDANYDTPYLQSPKIVVYLSHVQWQEKDEATMDGIFDYTDTFQYLNDSGPVLYITLGEAYEIWK